MEEEDGKEVEQNALGEHLDAYWTIQEYGNFMSDWLTFIKENK